MMMKPINFQIYMFMSISFFMMIIYSLNFHNKKTHPLIMISLLILLLTFSSLNMSMYLNNHWFSFILFLIMVGGMMIIFLYFTSFINNMKTSMKWMYIKNLHLKFSLMIISLIMMINLMKKHNWFLSFNEIMSINKFINLTNNNNMTLMYMYPKNFTTSLSMLYLLISLTIIVKICLMKKLTLRKFN
uniref:NADH dehydrogenase subunit 6 n=1 Tax=Eurytoma sp. ZJUH_2016013 TaxID=2491157 RepID=A0A3S8V0N0_9HYME|nr:NADH dehydrogenase subunit 6 [Eurytoma sp. ZJUH_2016013]